MLKSDLGTIKNETAASDLPPEGPPKERWVELSKISRICQKGVGSNRIERLSPDAVVLNTGEAED